mmetsp:Transcript_46939/g.121102  ORF Transcript_46939/g.121102 Transcript_46939/m.121102 type:complete len:321 (-) Transcript_46939:877-1839(-)
MDAGVRDFGWTKSAISVCCGVGDSVAALVDGLISVGGRVNMEEEEVCFVNVGTGIQASLLLKNGRKEEERTPDMVSSEAVSEEGGIFEMRREIKGGDCVELHPLAQYFLPAHSGVHYCLEGVEVRPFLDEHTNISVVAPVNGGSVLHYLKDKYYVNENGKLSNNEVFLLMNKEGEEVLDKIMSKPLSSCQLPRVLPHVKRARVSSSAGYVIERESMATRGEIVLSTMMSVALQLAVPLSLPSRRLHLSSSMVLIGSGNGLLRNSLLHRCVAIVFGRISNATRHEGLRLAEILPCKIVDVDNGHEGAARGCAFLPSRNMPI